MKILKKFSLFENGITNVSSSKEISLSEFLNMVQRDSPLLQKVRTCSNKDERNLLKRKLDYVTFSGIFEKRNNNQFKKSSGYACFDADDVQDLSALKLKLRKDKFVHCFFVSPSGNGLKFLVKIPLVKSDAEYKEYWQAISSHFNLPSSDESTKDISRACFLSYDPEPYFNPNSEIFTDKITEIAEQSSEKPKDDSRSALEYRRAVSEFRKGKTRAEVQKILLAYKKFADAPEQYREITLDKAESFVLSEQEKTEAYMPSNEEIELLENPQFFDLLISEFAKKIEGEENSKRAIFLSLASIWNKDSEVPLNTFVSAESSSGKSFLCKNIIKIFPKELVEYRTKITPEAFTYWKRDEDWSWDGKICYLEDISQSILDSPTFKVMCSEGTTATIVLKQKAYDIEIQGTPVMLLTTARTNPNTEILNRFQIVSLDESKEQTRRIVFRQALQKNSLSYDAKFTNALRVLQRKKVYVPFAESIAKYLDFNYNFESIRLRRDFSRLLNLVKASAVLHQYQRKTIDDETIEANEQDYSIASEVINYIQTATFRGLTHKLRRAYDCCKKLGEFTAKEIHAHFPFVNQKMWYLYLDDLCERGMLTTTLRRVEESKKSVTYFKVASESSFSLPDFANLLQNITNDTIVTNDTINTIVTNDTINTIVTNDTSKEENKCNNCNNYNKKEQKKPSKCVKCNSQNTHTYSDMFFCNDCKHREAVKK